jgi:hypothetical protein
MMCPRHHQHVVDHSSLAGCRASRCDCRNKSPAKQDWHTCPFLANNPSQDDCRSKSLAKQDWHTCPLANNPSSSMMCLRQHQWWTTVAVLPHGTIAEAKAWRSKIDTHAHWLTIPHGTTMVDHSCRTASRDDYRSKSLAEQDWHTFPQLNDAYKTSPWADCSLTERLPKQKPGEARGTRLSKQTFWSTPRVGLTGLLSKQKSGRASRNECRNKSLARLEAHDCRNKRFGQHRGWAWRDYCRNKSLAEPHGTIAETEAWRS